MNPVNTNPTSSQLTPPGLLLGARLASARYIASLSYLDDNNPAILELALDVTQSLAVDAAFKAAAAHFADSYYIDVVVNNAGYSLSGDPESVTEHEMHDEFELLWYRWSESVAREMHPDWNIHFCIVEPSAVNTNLEASGKKYTKPHPAYSAADMTGPAA
ncbi:uncharacterized protein BDW43DRAFT_311126 [Aspergillus alliaceus]|uniref:uncharacterized protein n=1 Tax=Petromyces alliaceus TaxID=209559 RepID=UPI0012A56D14|nr:uncharacterized protein BDW43DRAFT_311126 [Aspergillus alliaceus]KAB8233410.1 hypothetical protein BDW43DRAFT_311126 [Aspergillus alliaceus]